MIAALICAASLAALLQFFVAYCRLVLASSGKIELSQHVQEVAGVEGKGVSAEDFERFLELVRLCPEHETDRTKFRSVEIYYRLLSKLGRASRALIPSLAAWTENERRNCSHFAAVALDRRISLTRGLSLQHGLHSL